MALFKKIIRWLLLIATVLVIGGMIWLFALDGVERIVNNQITRLIGDRLPLRVDIGSMEGTLVTDLELHDVSVTYIDSTGDYTLGHISRLSASYAMSELLSRRWNFEEIVIESPVVNISKDRLGQWRLPEIKGTSGGEPTPVPQVIIGSLDIRDAVVSVVTGSDSLYLSNVNLSASFLSQEQTYSASLKSLSFKSNRESLYLDNASGKVTLTGDDAYLQDVSVTHGKSRSRLNGTLNLDSLSGTAEIDLDNIILEDLRKFSNVRLSGTVDVSGEIDFDRSGFSGTVNIGGEFQRLDFANLTVGLSFGDKLLSFDTLYGSVLGGCAVDGKGYIDFAEKDQDYYLDASIKHFNLTNLVRETFYSDLNGTISLSGKSFKSTRLKIDLAAELEESVFDEYSFHGGRGDMLITRDSLVFADSFLFSYFENEFFVDGRIGFRDSIDLDIVGHLANLDRYEGKLFIDQPGGRGYMEAGMTGMTTSPDLRGWFSSDSIWLYDLYSDSMYAKMDIGRFLTGKQGWVDIEFDHGAAWKLPYDSGYAHLTLDSNLVYIDTSNLAAELATVAARGKVDYDVYPQEVVLDSVNVLFFDQELFNRSQILFGVDSAGFNFTQAVIGSSDAHMSVRGRTGYDESMDMTVSAANIELGPWVALLELGVPLDGRLSLDATVGGDFLSPVLSIEGSIDSLRLTDTTGAERDGLFLGDVIADLSYADRLLIMDSLILKSRPGIYRAVGQLPADLAFTADSVDRLPDLPLDLRLSAQDSRFDLVSYTMPSVEQLDGDMSVDVRLSGTPSDPHLDGYGYLKGAKLKYFDLVDPIYADMARVVMQDKRILLNTDSVGVNIRNDHIVLSGVRTYVLDKKKDTSWVDVTGVITVKSLDMLHYDLDVVVPEDMQFRYELEDMDGVITGSLRVEGDTPPTVTGDLNLVKMSYEVPFAEVDEGSPILLALAGEDTWDLDLDIDVQPNLRVKNDDIDALFSGDLKLIRESGLSRFQGNLEVVRGKGYLFDRTFSIDAGSEVFFEGNMPPNPRLDIVARTRVTITPLEGEDDREEVELAVHVTGTLETPEINTVEGSEFDREDILPLLVANYYGGEAGAFDARFAQYVSNQVADISAQLLGDLGTGVETIEIDPATNGEVDFRSAQVTLGLHTLPQLYLYGRSTPGQGQWGQEVGFEYRISKKVMLEGQRSDQEEYILNLKLHYEF